MAAPVAAALDIADIVALAPILINIAVIAAALILANIAVINIDIFKWTLLLSYLIYSCVLAGATAKS